MARRESPLYREVHGTPLFMALTSGPCKVLFYSDAFIVYVGRKQKEIPYKDIKRIWKGRYHLSPRGSKVYVEEYPGSRVISKTPAFLPNGRQVQDMLVRTSATKILFKDRTPLVLERQNHERVDILHVQDEKKVIEILKTHAPWIELSPAFDV